MQQFNNSATGIILVFSLMSLDKHLLVGKFYSDSFMTKRLPDTNGGIDGFANMSICQIQRFLLFQEEAATHRKCNLFYLK